MRVRTKTVDSVVAHVPLQDRMSPVLLHVVRRARHVPQPWVEPRAATSTAPKWSRARRSPARGIRRCEHPQGVKPLSCRVRRRFGRRVHCVRTLSASLRWSARTPGRVARYCGLSRRRVHSHSTRTARQWTRRELSSGHPSLRVAVQIAIGRCSSAKQRGAVIRQGRKRLRSGLAARRGVQQGFDDWVVRVDVVARVKRMIWIRGFPDSSRARRPFALPRAVHDSGGGRCCRDVGRVKSMGHLWLVVVRRVRSTQAQSSARVVESESNLSTVPSEERAEGGVRNGFRFGVCLGGGESDSCVGATTLVFGRRFVAFGSTLGTVFVPVGPLAPAAGGPLVTPLFIRLRTRPLRICSLRSLLLSADGESVRRTWIQLELATYVPNFSIAENAARRTDGERKITHAGVER
eukprot:6211780-Pleurochrysis_carterae.AAC.5